MPKVFYHEEERRIIINGMAFDAEPFKAKRVLEAFGIEMGQELDLYTGIVSEHGQTLGIMPNTIMSQKKMLPIEKEVEGEDDV